MRLSNDECLGIERVFQCDTAEEIIGILRQLNDNDTYGHYLYRGQACKSYHLTPKLFRRPYNANARASGVLDSVSEMFLESEWTKSLPIHHSFVIQNDNGEDITRNTMVTKENIDQLCNAYGTSIYESIVVNEFISRIHESQLNYGSILPFPQLVSDSPHLSTRVGITSRMRSLRNRLYRNGEFLSSIRLNLTNSLLPLTSLSIATHEEVSTSALDFTKNPLKALWFAASHRQSQNPHRFATNSISVYAVNIYRLRTGQQTSDPLATSNGFYKIPNPGNSRALAQEAWIYSHPGLFWHYAFGGHSIDSLVHSLLASKYYIRRYDVPEGESRKILEILRRNGISREYMLQSVSAVVDDLSSNQPGVYTYRVPEVKLQSGEHTSITVPNVLAARYRSSGEADDNDVGAAVICHEISVADVKNADERFAGIFHTFLGYSVGISIQLVLENESKSSDLIVGPPGRDNCHIHLWIEDDGVVRVVIKNCMKTTETFDIYVQALH